MNGLSCGEEIMTIRSAVLIQYQRMTDGQTDRRTDGQTDVQPISITCFSIADARKNYTYFNLPCRGLGSWPGGLTNYCPSVFWHCDTVGLVIWPVKIVPSMTYNVFGVTLNPTLLLLLLHAGGGSWVIFIWCEPRCNWLGRGGGRKWWRQDARLVMFSKTCETGRG